MIKRYIDPTLIRKETGGLTMICNKCIKTPEGIKKATKDYGEKWYEED